MVDAAVPLLGYAVGFVLGGTTPAAVVAVAVALVVGVVRRVCGDSLRTIVIATMSVVGCASLALGTDSGRSFFAPEVATNAGALLVLTGSLVLRRPITGYISQRFGFDLPGWRDAPERHRVHRTMTAAWAVFLVLRLCVLVPLFLLHEVVTLAVVDAVLLKPSGVIALVGTGVWMQRVRSGTPGRPATPVGPGT